MEKISYSLGVILAKNLQQQGIDSVDAKSLAQAIEDVYEGNALQIDAAEANRLVQQHMTKGQQAKYDSVIKEGEKFLAENAKREEVVTTSSGLQYEILSPGKGPHPTASDKVTVHYHGKLLDGTVFDSSIERGDPATFGVTQVIKGWVEALQKMKVGSKWRLFIPWQLAYGERGAGGSIGPYSTLIFDVELLNIVGKS